MKSILSEGKLLEVPDIMPVTEPVMQILDGPFAGVWFTLSDMVMDDVDEGLMHYNLEVAGATVDEIKPVVDNFIISLMYEQLERLKNESKKDEAST